MDEQLSLFEEGPRREDGPRYDPPPGAPAGPPTDFRYLDRVQLRGKDDDPIQRFQERLVRFFHKEPLLYGGRLWFRWGEGWTFCEARPLSSGNAADIYRAVWGQT